MQFFYSTRISQEIVPKSDNIHNSKNQFMYRFWEESTLSVFNNIVIARVLIQLFIKNVYLNAL